MRRLIVVSLAAAFVASLAPIVRSDPARLSLVRVKVESAADGRFLASSYDETHNHVPGYVELVLWPGDAAELDALGFHYEVLTADLSARDSTVAAAAENEVVQLPGPDRSDYRRLPDYVQEMEQLAKEHRSLVELIELPRPTLEDRKVLALGIRAGGDDGRPTFYVDGIHHAREWPAAEYPMIFAHYLVDEFGRDDEVTRLLKQARVVIVPIVNPDGFDYSRESVQGLNRTVDTATSTPTGLLGLEAYWRKNRRSLTGLTVPAAQKNPDAYGVDPNRNYSWHWGAPSGSSGTQVNQTYRGSAPFSEPESTNVAKLLLKTNVTALISNHTYSRLVIRPWGDTQRDAPDEVLMERLGQVMADAMGGYSNIKGIELYATTGTTSDYAYGVLGSLGYTFEHGRAFHPPYSDCSADCVGTEWPGVMKAFMLGLDAAADPRLHSVVSGRVVAGGGPVRARLRIAKKVATPLGKGNPTGEEAFGEKIELALRTARDGSFEWHLNPSTAPFVAEKGKTEAYRLTVSAPGAGERSFTLVLERGERLDLGTIRL